jgi:tetratricopeptide (TPR) repeat protein
LNVEAFPESFNTYDSLGEAYAAAGEKELAIRNYEKSLQLNPNSQSGIDALKKLKAK